MLCLSRRIGETLIIGDNIRVTVMEISSQGKVKLGIEASREIDVHREEVWKKIQEQKEQQAS